jgi:hypothetical protein
MTYTPQQIAEGVAAILAKVDFTRNNVVAQTTPIDLTLGDLGWLSEARRYLTDDAPARPTWSDEDSVDRAERALGVE